MSTQRFQKDVRERQWLIEIEPWHKSFWETVQNLLRPAPRPRLPQRIPGVALYPAPRLNVEIQPWHQAFAQMLGEVFQPRKLPPLKVTSKPVEVADIWDTPLYAGQFRRSGLVSALVHSLVLLLVAFPLAWQAAQAQPEKKVVDLVSLDDIAPYKVVLPQSARKSGGGGGGGERSKLKASKGRLPRFSLDAQLTPPAAVIRNPFPKLAAEPTLVVPPNIQVESPNIAAYGDPKSDSQIPSSGTGYGGGIGTGSGGGVGSGFGPGLGPGRGGGYGGGAFMVGGSVSRPVCIYCPDPEYTDEARKARHQGLVVLWAIVDESGRVRDLRVQKSLGMGLDESAVRTVMQWRFKPGERFGKTVPVQFAIEVNFTLH
ncbi:MAG: energy transducer TonB [Acidobacteria bacterium]|nr:energy transducer TonB [Acidobacteriota bacterium]